MRRRTSVSTLDRPAGRDFQRQNRRKPARWQDTTVSGLTNESISPTRIPAAERDPQEPIDAIEPGARPSAFENVELLAQDNGLQRKPMARQKECANVRDDRNEQTHRSDNSASRRERNKRAKCFSLRSDQILMTHSQRYGRNPSWSFRGPVEQSDSQLRSW